MKAHGETLPFSGRRVVVLAAQAFLEAVRLRVFQFATVFAVALVVGGLGLREFDFGGAGPKLVADFGFGALVAFGSVLTIVTTVQLFGGELEQRTALPVLARPVRRSEFVCGKFLGAWSVVLVFCVLVLTALCLTLWTQRAGAAPAERLSGAAVSSPYTGVLVGGALQVVKFGLLTAIVLLIASHAQTSLFAQVISFLVLVICHLQYLAREVWQSGAGWLARGAGGLIGLVFPDFQVFGGEGWTGGADGPSLLLAGRIVLYGVVYTAVFLALTVWSFRHREI